MKLKTQKGKGTDADMAGPKKKVKQLTAYYLQGGKWQKVKQIKGVF